MSPNPKGNFGAGAEIEHHRVEKENNSLPADGE